MFLITPNLFIKVYHKYCTFTVTFILSKDPTDSFLLFFCLSKRKVTKEKDSTNRAYFPA
jgi:hypothetical protein